MSTSQVSQIIPTEKHLASSSEASQIIPTEKHLASSSQVSGGSVVGDQTTTAYF